MSTRVRYSWDSLTTTSWNPGGTNGLTKRRWGPDWPSTRRQTPISRYRRRPPHSPSRRTLRQRTRPLTSHPSHLLPVGPREEDDPSTVRLLPRSVVTEEVRLLGHLSMFFPGLWTGPDYVPTPYLGITETGGRRVGRGLPEDRMWRGHPVCYINRLRHMELLRWILPVWHPPILSGDVLYLKPHPPS